MLVPMKQRHRRMLLCVTATSLASVACKEADRTDSIVNDDAAEVVSQPFVGKVAKPVEPIGTVAMPIDTSASTPTPTPPTGATTHRVGKVANTPAPVK
jgi:hypothetical protein